MKQKLVVVTGAFPQLSQTFIVRLVEHLDRKIISNKVVESEKKHHNLSSIDIYDVGIKRSYTQKLYHKFFKKFRFVFNNAPVYHWHQKELKQLQKILIQQNITGVIAAFGTHGISINSVCKKLNIPLITYFFGYDASPLLLDYPHYVADLKVLFKDCKYIVVLNDWVVQKFTALGCPKEKIKKINFGVPVDAFVPNIVQKKTNFRFLAVGRMTAKKAPLQTIKAFELCADKNAHVRLDFIGDGDLMSTVKVYLQNSRHQSKIRLHGAQPNHIVQSFFRESNCFLQHSITSYAGDMEGWPTAIAEACCFGIPTISTRHAGIVDQIIHGKTGFLVKELDYENMAKYMCVLSSDFVLTQEMGAKAREHIKIHGDVKVQAQKIRNLFK